LTLGREEGNEGGARESGDAEDEGERRRRRRHRQKVLGHRMRRERRPPRKVVPLENVRNVTKARKER